MWAAVGGLRLLAVLFLLTLGLLAVLRAPSRLLWMMAIGATEWGHLLALAAVALALVPGSVWLSALSVLSALLLLTPLVRAVPVAQALPAALSASFGEVSPRSLPGAPARPAPLVLQDLLHLPTPPVGLRTLEWTAPAGHTLALDLLQRSDAPTPQPVVVLLHGGFWYRGHRAELPALGRYLAGRGYAVAAIDYRLAPQDTFPAPRDDVLSAVAFLREQADALGLDGERIALLGRSAGGHLALSAAPSAAVQGVVALYPPVDLLAYWQHPADPVSDTHAILSEFLGGSPQTARQRFDDASPSRHVPASGFPPTLLIHGARDDMVPLHHSEAMAAALQVAGVPHHLLILPASTHGFDANLAGPGGQLSLYAIERFLAIALAR